MSPFPAVYSLRDINVTALSSWRREQTETFSDPEGPIFSLQLLVDCSIMVCKLVSSQWGIPTTCHYPTAPWIRPSPGHREISIPIVKNRPWPICSSLQHDPDNILALEHQDFLICGGASSSPSLTLSWCWALDLLVSISLERSLVTLSYSLLHTGDLMTPISRGQRHSPGALSLS